MKYYAVVHGDRGNHTFAPMRKPPAVSKRVFAYEGPATEDDAQMRADFDARFLPLRVSCFDADGKRLVSDATSFKGEGALEEARSLGSALLQRRARWVVIATKDDRTITVLPDGIPYSPMPFVVAEYLALQGSIIGRLSWPSGQFLPCHSTTEGAYTIHYPDGSTGTWVPSEADREACDWSGLGPVI